MRLRAATRGSPLARWQAERVAELVAAAHPGAVVEPVVVSTAGDRTQASGVPLWTIGGKGVFASEVQAAVLDGRARLAVHSAKDLPSTSPPGLVIAAVPERADPRDALVGAPLDALGPGAVVATGAPRRRAQLAHLRPDLTFAELRGNLHTRVARAAEVGAVVVALAALQRLDLTHEVAQVLGPEDLLPQAGQGALAVECRADDHATRELLAAIDHEPSRRALTAERAFLARLGGDCSLPAAALAEPAGGGLALRTSLASLDGRVVLRARHEGHRPEALGRAAAEALLGAGGPLLLDPTGGPGGAPYDPAP